MIRMKADEKLRRELVRDQRFSSWTAEHEVGNVRITTPRGQREYKWNCLFSETGQTFIS